MTVRSTTGPRIHVVRFVFSVLLLLAALGVPAHGQAPSRVDVVALMVEFQPDTTRFTTGDGTFSGVLFEGVEPPTIDPLPHDASYFDAHLRFLENYVGRVADGRTTVTTHLLPDVVRVSGTMGQYSPTGVDAGSDAELSKLSALIDEAWTLADQSTMALPAGLDPATTSFVIFHAGVGRDIELVGTTLDKTPEDIPSIFFDQRALNRLGASGVSMDGFPVSNSMIIPRTESRLGVDPLTSEPFLVELSTNGLLAASFFNYLGVPDLFNTETGDSAIGPFGLMDALGIFAYSGLFPPEPSAWTKQFLGWGDVVTTSGGAETVQLTYAGHPSQNEMARVPISGSEYFLVENRYRDAAGDGVRMRVWTPSGEQEVVFENGDPEFNDQTVTGFPGGVVLEVDDYDFALPGGIDENDNDLLGGVLIWHIDENRLAAGLGDNRINADRNARSIDLEEADGAQDIGFGSGASFFGPRFDLGTPFDFWFEGNPVTVRTSRGQDIRLYENRFAGDTEPSSLNNAGGLTGVVLSNFSAVGPEMTFQVDRQAAGDIALLNTSTYSLPDWGPSIEGGELLYDSIGDTIWAWFDNSWVSPEGCTGQDAPVRPVVLNDAIFTMSSAGFSWGVHVSGDVCVQETLLPIDVDALTWTTSSIEHVVLVDEVRFFVGIENSDGPGMMIITLHADGRVDEAIIPLTEPARFIFVESRSTPGVMIVTDSGVRDSQGDLLVAAALSGIQQASLSGTTRDWSLAWTSSEAPDLISILNASRETTNIRPVGECTPEYPMWRDLDSDGMLDLAFACGSSIQAVHHSGAVLEGYPLGLDSPVSAQPVFASSASGDQVVVVRTEQGYVEAHVFSSGRWSSIDGFPFSAGKPVRMAPLVQNGVLSVLESNGDLQNWSFAVTDASDAANSGVMVRQPNGSGTTDSGSRLLVGEQTYNWPNPIETGSTRIRFEVREASSVVIDIVDLSGVRIDRLEVASASPGVPTEVIWQTEAGSGIYMARVKATALSGGSTDTRLVRMAIIR